ncbi:hypothetical protein KSS87_009712 [Heliosperma pusillum]|nr:hypothetical protein KSS87_009712 [Heliosperma pusillum]
MHLPENVVIVLALSYSDQNLGKTEKSHANNSFFGQCVEPRDCTSVTLIPPSHPPLPTLPPFSHSDEPPPSSLISPPSLLTQP